MASSGLFSSIGVFVLERMAKVKKVEYPIMMNTTARMPCDTKGLLAFLAHWMPYTTAPTNRPKASNVPLFLGSPIVLTD